MLKLAVFCVFCGMSFENWVTGKVMNHLRNHFEKGDKELELRKLRVI